MTTRLVKTAATAAHDAVRPPANEAPVSAGSRTGKAPLGVLAVALLMAISCATLWSSDAGGNAGPPHPGVAAPAVRLAGAVTSIEGHTEPRIQALSGPMIPLEPVSTVSERNAVRAAKQYLDYTAFSRQGLIDQLEYDDFSTADATFAVDSIAVNWNAQAAKAAKNYLDYTAFSRGGLIDQLEYDGFTPAQAAYGATAVGL